MRLHKVREIVLCGLVGMAFVFALIVGIPLAERTFGSPAATKIGAAADHQKN